MTTTDNMTTTDKTLILTKTTAAGVVIEIYRDDAASASARYEVVLGGVSGGSCAGPKEIKSGSARNPVLIPVIAWGSKMVQLTEAEAKLLGQVQPAQVSAKRPTANCRVCGGVVRYDEQYARPGYCGCEGE